MAANVVLPWFYLATELKQLLGTLSDLLCLLKHHAVSVWGVQLHQYRLEQQAEVSGELHILAALTPAII
jgi:hypothetical protein